MSRSTCKYLSCDRPVGSVDREDYRDSKFCSPKCEVRYEHIKEDARHARES